ncbi:Plug domain-containing protein, partial [Mycobacterium tuberculosis]|nr:Plug domain-containing protein [Mycobacterium tuberculosis]
QDTSLYDALRNTAGVTRQQLSGETFDNLAIRGVTLENRTNFRFNGSMPMAALTAIPLEDKERVEVLKGVSALYYGYT